MLSVFAENGKVGRHGQNEAEQCESWKVFVEGFCKCWAGNWVRWEILNPANNFILVDTQDQLSPSDWANELHPYLNGFKTVAGKFVDALRLNFPGRI